MNELLVAALLVASGSIGAIVHKLVSRWPGVPTDDGHLEFEGRGRGRLLRLELGLPTRAWLDFECRHESGLDRFFKRLGWTREIQVGRDAFDRAVYLVADDPRIEALMKENPEACARIHRLFCSLPPAAARLRGLVCRDGILRILLATQGDDGAGAVRQWALAHLRALQSALPSPGGLSVPRRDRALVHAALVEGPCWGLLLNGVFQGARLWYVTGVPVVDGMALLSMAAWTAAGVVALLLLLAFWLVGRSSRFHPAFLRIVLVGSLGALSTAYAGLSDLNRVLDRSALQRQWAILIPAEPLDLGWNLSASRVEVISPGIPNGHRVRVPSGLEGRLSVGQVAALKVRRGGLGLVWIEGLDAPTDEEARRWREQLGGG